VNLRLDIAYDGEPFRGYARQPDQRTVQGDLEDALARLMGRDVETYCAGRTDAGVHALGQVVSIPDAPADTDLDRIRDGLTGMLGPAISVHGVRVVPEDFHARFSARSRCYVYAILDGPDADPFLARTALHHRERLDEGAMAEAAGHLVGDHDFSSFGRVPDPEASAVRNLFELRVVRDGSLIRVRARANAFIQQMVRSLVGTLLYVGERRRSPDEMPGVLEARDRASAGPVAPAHGLCLVAVEYDEGWSRPVPVV
jgi:tRNA pseudouridine38-40 synthase